MSKKKRAAIAVAVSATAGSAAGTVAAYCGLDFQDSANIGAMVSGTVGNLLYQALRLTPNDTASARTGVATGNGAPHSAESDITNAPHDHADTAIDTIGTDPKVKSRREHTRGATVRRSPRHRKLERGSRRRVERNAARQQDDHGRGNDHGAA
ncbi:hypothetical protein [Streptomyces sp. MS2.AVA.5]|uniref:Uncharacterized protein n=1 Tax=Streptomyces achmelvichensis TaxID=3134111 RepID=A0ACC6PUK1_9ACTN